MDDRPVVVRGDEKSVHVEPRAVDPNAWLSSNSLVTTDRLTNVMLNNLANDIRNWRGTVNAGGNVLSNVVLENVGIPGALTDPTQQVGDLIVRGSTISRLAVGANGQVLIADSTQPLGMRWGAAAGGGGALTVNVNGVFAGTRSTLNLIGGANTTIAGADNVGANRVDVTITATGGTGVGVPTTRQIATGTGLTGGGDLSIDRTISVVADTTTQRLEAAQAGTLIGTRKQFNFIAGTGTTLNVTDNAANNRVDVTVSLSGTGPPTPLAIAVNGSLIGTRSELNLIGGANTTITGLDNSGAGRVDVTITATGGGGGGAVISVFGRDGVVVAQNGDYSAAMVTNAVSTQGSYADPAWITSLSWSKIAASGTPSSSVFLRGDGTWAAPPGGGGGAGSQTPWESDINASSFSLNLVKNIGIGLNALGNFPLTIWADVNTAHAIYVVSHGCSGYGFFQQESDPTKAASFGLLNDAGQSSGFFLGGSAHPIPFYRGNGVFSCSGDFVNFATSVRFFTNSMERMQITTEGAVNVSNALIVDLAGFNSGASADILFGGGAGVSGEGIGSNRVNYLANQWGLDFYTNNQARVHITNGGWVGIGMMPTTNLAVAGNVNITGQYQVNGSPLTAAVSAYNTAEALVGTRSRLRFSAGGSLTGLVTDMPALDWIDIYYGYVPSDARLKDNIETLTEGGLSALLRIRPVTAEYNGLAGTKPGYRIVSAVAQEVQQIIPEAVYTYSAKLRPDDTETTELLGLDPIPMLFHAVLAIQQLAERLEKLEKQLEGKS